jgi:hypothetical protein
MESRPIRQGAGDEIEFIPLPETPGVNSIAKPTLL